MSEQLVSSKKQYLSGIYTFIVATLPVFASYASGIPGFSVADILLVLFTAIAFCTKKRCNAISVGPLRFLGWGVCLIAFCSLFALAGAQSFGSKVDVLIRLIRYGFYIFCVLFTSRRLLSLALLKKYIVLVAVLASVFIAIQAIAYYYFGYVIRGFFTNLPLYSEGYATRDYEYLFSTVMYRPTSFFLEPAHFARYAILGVCLLLWKPDAKATDYWLTIVISGAIVLSTSTQGYFLLCFVWIAFFILALRKAKSASIRIWGTITFLLLPVIVYGVLRIPIVQDTIQRSFSGELTDTNTALGARMFGFSYYFNLPLYNQVFGAGFGLVPQEAWLSSAAYWMYGGGGIVFLAYCLFLGHACFKLRGWQRIVFLCFSFLFFTDDSFYSYMCIIFYSLTLYREKQYCGINNLR